MDTTTCIDNCKKRKAFAYSEDGSAEFETEYCEGDEYDASLSRFNTTKMLKLEPESEGKDSVQDNRKYFTGRVEKALVELSSVSRVLDLLKRKENLSLLTCARQSQPLKGSVVPVTQRMAMKRDGLKRGMDILSRGLKNTAQLVKERQRFAVECIAIRKRWRLVHIPTSQSIIPRPVSHSDGISVDCSFFSAGDSIEINDHTLGIRVDDKCSSNSDHSNHLKTICITLLYNDRHVLASCNDWDVMVPALAVDRVPGSLDWECVRKQHDVASRRFFLTVTSAATTGSFPWTVSSLASCPQCSDGVSDEWLPDALQALYSHPLHQNLQILSLTRSEVRVAVSRSLSLSITLAPLPDSVCFENRTADEERCKEALLAVSRACLALQKNLMFSITKRFPTILNVGNLNDEFSCRDAEAGNATIKNAREVKEDVVQLLLPVLHNVQLTIMSSRVKSALSKCSIKSSWLPLKSSCSRRAVLLRVLNGELVTLEISPTYTEVIFSSSTVTKVFFQSAQMDALVNSFSNSVMESTSQLLPAVLNSVTSNTCGFQIESPHVRLYDYDGICRFLSLFSQI